MGSEISVAIGGSEACCRTSGCSWLVVDSHVVNDVYNDVEINDLSWAEL